MKNNPSAELALGLSRVNLENKSTDVSWHYKFGATNILSASDTNEAVWNGGGDYTGFPSESETLSVFSDDAGDTNKSVTIIGLDADFKYLKETVVLNGTTPVTTTGVFSRAPRAYISSGLLNLGDVTIRHSSTIANVMAKMPATFGQTQICAFTVPAETQCIIKNVGIRLGRSSGADGSSLVSLRARILGETGFRAKKVGIVTTSAAWDYNYEGGIVFPGKTDIKVIIETISDNASFFTAELEYKIVGDYFDTTD